MNGLMEGMSPEAQVFVAALIVAVVYVGVRLLRSRRRTPRPYSPDQPSVRQEQGADISHEQGEGR